MKEKNYYFASKLNALMENAKIDRGQLADLLDVSDSSVNHWLTGDLPKLETLMRISELFHITINNLIYKPIGFEDFLRSPELIESLQDNQSLGIVNTWEQTGLGKNVLYKLLAAERLKKAINEFVDTFSEVEKVIYNADLNKLIKAGNDIEKSQQRIEILNDIIDNSYSQ